MSGTTRQIRILGFLAAPAILAACSTNDLRYPPATSLDQLDGPCPVNTTRYCKVGNSSRVRSARKVVICRCG